jgi:hypothetical protein
VNLARRPDAKRDIVSGVFHRARCPGCGAVLEADTTFTYADLASDLFIFVAPSNGLLELAHWEASSQAAIDGAFSAGPSLVTAQRERLRFRLVFGLGDLAEKLRLFDAALDDRIAELMKLELWIGLGLPTDARLRAVAATADGQLRLQVKAASSTEPTFLEVSAERYQQLSAAGPSILETNALGTGPFVDARRFLPRLR